MAVLIAALGLFVYLSFARELDETMDAGLRARVSTLSALARARGDTATAAGLREGLARQGESFAQIIDARGHPILNAAAEVKTGGPLLTPAELARARSGPLLINREQLSGVAGGARLLAVPVRVRGQTVAAVVGTSLRERTRALANLVGLLIIGGPVALLAASFLGYGLASAALRPVELMRRRAATISARQPGARLPLPRARDEIHRLGRTLNAMLARLEAAVQRLQATLERERSFVANASHELRTPLAILKSELEVALRGPQTPAALGEAVSIAADETDRLARLADDLLLLARLDEGRVPMRPSRVWLQELFASLENRFAARAAQHHRELHSTAPDGLWIIGDKLRLEQALGNLLDNALRHGRGRILLTAERGEGDVELHVRDQGQFPPHFIAGAFERFSRADHARSQAGAGLGLAIVASIAEAHRGAAHAANHPDGGADVWITLPQTPHTKPGDGEPGD